MNQLKYIYNNSFKGLYSHSIHTCFPIIASNDNVEFNYKKARLGTLDQHFL